MKKIFLAVFYFLFVFNNPAHPESIPPNNETNAVHELYDLCNQQIVSMETALISVLATLHNYQQYWLKQQVRPSYTLLPHSIHDSMYGKTVRSVFDEALQQLENAISKNAQNLGELRLKKDALVNRKKNDDYQEIQTITLFISSLLNQQTADTPQQEMTPVILHALIVHNLANIKQYANTSLQSLSPYAKPGHFKRNWGKYAIIGFCTVIGLYNYIKNKSAINQWIAQSPDVIKNFYQTYVATPLKNSWDIIFHPDKGESVVPKEGFLPPNQIKNDENFLELFFKQEALKLNNAFPKNEQLTEEEIDHYVHNAVIRRDTSRLNDDYDEQFKYPLYNLGSPNGSVVRLVIIWVLNTMLRAEDIIMKTEGSIRALEKKYIKSSQLNFELSVTIPAVAGVYGLYKLYARYRTKTWNRFILKPIHQTMRQIQVILNRYTSDISLDVKDYGLLYYWTHILLAYNKYLPANDQISLKQDLEHLASLHYTIPQKKEVIERMYRTYDFLLEPLKK